MQLAQSKATIKGLFLALGVAGLVSCGSGDEAGGGGSCGGVDESGICLQAALIEPTHLDDQFTSDIDINFVPDCDGMVATNDPEPFTEHFAEITFGASLVSGTPVAASFVQLTDMIVTYTQNTIDPPVTCLAPILSGAVPTIPPDCNAVAGAGPAISTLTTSIDVTIPVGTSVTQVLPLMNFERKNFWTPGAGFFICDNGPFDPTVPVPAGTGICFSAVIPLPDRDPAYLSYTVRYFFSGEDEFGNSVDATAATEVTVGAYNNCP